MKVSKKETQDVYKRQAVESYLDRLVSKGYKVAICEPVSYTHLILVKFLLPTDLILSGSAFPASCSRYWMGKNRMISTWI